MLDVYYWVEYMDTADQVIITTTSKKYFDSTGAISDGYDTADEIINRAMNAYGYNESSESEYETGLTDIKQFNHADFIRKLAEKDINMICKN